MEQSLSHFNDSHSDTNWDHSNTLLSDLNPALQPPNGKHDQNRKQLVSFISQWIWYTPSESLSQCTVTRISEVTFPNAKLALGPHQKKQLNYFPGSQVRLTVMPPIKEHESEWIPKPFFTTRPRYKRGANGQKKHICSARYSVSWRDQKRHTPTPLLARATTFKRSEKTHSNCLGTWQCARPEKAHATELQRLETSESNLRRGKENTIGSRQVMRSKKTHTTTTSLLLRWEKKISFSNEVS